MGKWQSIYQSLEAGGGALRAQLESAVWLDRFIPQLDEATGGYLTRGGMGADMLRCAQLDYEPYGLDLEEVAVGYTGR